MRKPVLLLALIVCLDNSALAKDDPKPAAALPSASTGGESYLVQLTEFRIKDSSHAGWSTDEIVKRFERRDEDGDVEIVETIRLSALSGHESMVQVGRRARVTVGVISTSGRGSTRQMESHNIGTLVSLTAKPADGKVLLKLSYECSRFEGEGTDESPPDTTTFQIDTTLLLEAGKPTLVAGSSASATSYLMVSVDQVRQIPGSMRTKSADAQPQKIDSDEADLRAQLIGTWKLEEASTPGSPSGIGTRLKFFTGTHWCIIQPDPNTGVVVFHHGGRYTLEGNKLKTTRDFAGESTQRMIGSSGTFEIQIVGDTKKQVDADGVFHETWKRVVPAAEAEPEPAAGPDPEPAAEPAPEEEPCDSERLGKPADRRFRFLFGDLPWEEWLHWLADQLGMSLVMDAPPPGTFHYSGTPDFEPEQAVDLLNGVLLSKGYTLVRRERTLRLLDLSVDLPDGVVFEVPLEAVDKFGRFELVTVKFGLSGRCPEAVEAAVKRC